MLTKIVTERIRESAGGKKTKVAREEIRPTGKIIFQLSANVAKTINKALDKEKNAAMVINWIKVAVDKEKKKSYELKIGESW